MLIFGTCVICGTQIGLNSLLPDKNVLCSREFLVFEVFRMNEFQHRVPWEIVGYFRVARKNSQTNSIKNMPITTNQVAGFIREIGSQPIDPTSAPVSGGRLIHI